MEKNKTNQELWGGRARIARLTAQNCKSGKLEMTIEPDTSYQVFLD